MVTQAQLRSEIKRLKAEKAHTAKRLRAIQVERRKTANLKLQMRREVIMSKRAKKSLELELRDLKNPRSAAFKRNLGRGLRAGGKVGGKGLKALWDALPTA